MRSPLDKVTIMKTGWMAAVAAGLLIACGGSSSDAARAAIAQAERAITDVHAYAIRYAPDEFKVVMDEYSAAREHLAQENYRGAVRSAERAVELATQVGRAATANRKELETSWAAVRDSVSTMVKAIEERVARGPGSGTITGEQLASAKTAAQEIAEGLREASKAAADGKLLDAVHAAAGLRARAEEILTSLGLAPGVSA